MRILRILFSRKFLDELGMDFGELFEGIEHADILEIYQYDNYNLFSKQRIIFNAPIQGNDEELEQHIMKKFSATYFYLLDRHENEMTCILKQTRLAQGFIPLYNLAKNAVWAIIPPLSMSPQSIILSIAISEKDMQLLMNLYPESGEFKVLSNTKIEDFKSGFGYSGFSMPSFTKRQKEIITLAIKRGYYQEPRKVSAEELSNELNITYGTFYEHLRKIENKVFQYFFG